MLDIGFQELLVIFVLALLILGPERLPDLARGLGRALREFRRTSDEFRATIETNLQLHGDPPPEAPAATAPVEAAAAPALEAGATPAPGPPDPVPLEAPALLAFEGPFCGRRGGRLIHKSPCGWAARIPEPERVIYKAAVEGQELGLVPCPVCDPRDEPAAP